MKSDFNWVIVIDVLLHQAPWTWLQGLHDANHHCGSQRVEIYDHCSHKGLLSNDNLDRGNVCPHPPVACPFFAADCSETKENIWKLTQGIEAEPPCYERLAYYPQLFVQEVVPTF